MDNRTSLFDKIYGCIAGSQIASSMGAPCEGWSVEQIEKKHGVIDKLLPLKSSAQFKEKEFPPGTTEDGIERHRFMVLAIIDKGGRISAGDLAAAWAKYGSPEKMAVTMGWWDVDLYHIAKTVVPPSEIGRYMPWHEVVSFARSCQPIGVINACDPEQAAKDAFDISRLYTYPALYSYGPEWAAVVTSAIAEALKPNSTVDSVLNAATTYVPDRIKKEIMDGVKLADKFKDVFDMRQAFNEKYNATGLMCAESMCPEIVTKGISIFYKTDGNVKESILGGVNFGRDTDCTAAVASGIAGAFNGTHEIPSEWIETVDKATKQNKYTVTQMTLKETAQALYDAVMKQIEYLDKKIQLLKQGL